MTNSQVVLIEEARDGKYLVIKSGDSRLFVAFKPSCIGGHSDMLAELKRARRGEDEDIEHLVDGLIRGRGGDKTRLMNAFKGIKDLDYLESIGGGQYIFEKGELELFGKSHSYGPVEPAILKEFEAPIREYCAKEGLELKTLKML